MTETLDEADPPFEPADEVLLRLAGFKKVNVAITGDQS